jgi:GxxExxY protein
MGSNAEARRGSAEDACPELSAGIIGAAMNVQGTAIVEIKAVESLRSLHTSQLLTCLRISGLPLGLLINFNVQHLRDGIHRRVMTR